MYGYWLVYIMSFTRDEKEKRPENMNNLLYLMKGQNSKKKIRETLH